MEILKVEELTFKYPLCTSPAVDEVSFSLQKGDFAVVCGSTGSGKSTLLRMLKRELAPMGEVSGRIYYNGTPIEDMDARTSAAAVGFVMQNTEQQIVTDKVWHELAFGLENMNAPQEVIARRVAEISGYFGIEDWYDKSVCELSGGQKQLLSLAAVMVMDPEVLILDEPTSQLDPIATSDFLSTVRRLHEDFSLTVIIVEHRLEELVPMCDRLLVMDGGHLVANGTPREVIASLASTDASLPAMPSAARLYHALGASGECPLTVREGRALIERVADGSVRSLKKEKHGHSDVPALEFKDVYFRYDRMLPDTLCGLDVTVYENEIFCILGGNGSGKTTALSAASGILRPYSGQIKVFGRKLKEYKGQSLYRECLALLPQDVQTVFLKSTVREELEDAGADAESLPFDISALFGKHPYDLSGGEQQLVALAKALAAKPRLLLMDEPTKGLDAHKKARLADILQSLKESGVTVVVVTHDVEFAATCADRCAMFFRGQVVSIGEPDEFFSENNFYTTAASRMSKGYFERAVTLEDVAKLCLLNARGDGGEVC